MGIVKASYISAVGMLGVLCSILMYAVLLTTGPVVLAGVIVNVLPLTLLVISLYLFICNIFFTESRANICRLADLLQVYSNNLTTWSVLSFLLIGCQIVLVWGGEALSFFYMGGLLPNGDGSSYYKGARRLLLEGDLSEWSSRRPFMTAYLAFILAISKFSLSATIAVVSAIAAFSIAVFASAIRRTEPLPVVLWAFVLVFFFYYRLVGTPLSENLGLTFGCISFAFLWLAADKKIIKLFLAGLLFMALAQATRSGAVFVLPALVIWGTFWLATGVRSRFAVLIGGCAAIILGFLLNRLLMEIGGAGSTAGFGNFSYTVYGLSVGEGGWSQIMKDHPEVVALAEPARSQGIYALAINNIINDPSSLFNALLRNFYMFAIANGGLNIVTGTKAWLLVQVPTLIGVIWCIRYIKNPRYAMLLFTLAGIIVSSIIVTEDGGLRVFAATIPFSAAIAAVGLPIKKSIQGAGALSHGFNIKAPVFSSSFLGAVVLLGIFITISVCPLNSGIQSEEKNTCSPEDRLLTITYPARTAIHLRVNEQEYPHYVPNVFVNDFRDALKHNGRRRDWPDIELLPIPYSMLSLGKYVLLPTALISNDPPEITVCTRRVGWLFIDQKLLKSPM